MGPEHHRRCTTIEIDSAAELDGLPADYVAAHAAGPNGKITLTTQQTDVVPVMLYAKNDDLRRRMYLEVRNVAYPANVPVLRRLLDLRFQIARLLGIPIGPPTRSKAGWPPLPPK